MPFKQFFGGAGTDWLDPANWVAGALPGAGDDVVVYADASIAAGTYSYNSLVEYLGATVTLADDAMVAVNEAYLLNSNLTGGTLTSGTLNVVDGGIENTTLVNAALASGLEVNDVGVAGTLSVDSQLSSGTDVLTVAHLLTLAGATELQFGQVSLQNAQLASGGYTLTVDPAAVLEVSAGSVATGPGVLAVNGTLLVDAGAVFRVGGTLVNHGTMLVDPAGLLDLAGTETTAQLAAILAAGGPVVLSGRLDNTGSSIDLAAGMLPASLFASTAGGGVIYGGTLVTAGQAFHPDTAGPATVLDGVTVSGTLELAGGATVLAGGTVFAGGPGTIQLDGGSLSLDDTAPVAKVVLESGSTLVAPHTVAGTTVFDGSSATLEFTGTGALSATLSRFRAGNSVRLDGLASGSLSLSGNVLTVADGTTTARLTLADGGSNAYALSDFHLVRDAAGREVLTTTHSTAAAASAPAPVADPLVVASFLYPQTGATPPSAAADAQAAVLYKSGGWRIGYNPDPWFDTKWYMANYGAEVLASGLDPLTHYETVGWREGHDPSLLFSTSFYLRANPDVAAAGMDPLEHYMVFGHSENRAVHVATSSQPADPLIDTARVAREVATLIPSGGADPAAISAFYHGGGWKVVNDPNPLFNAAYYLGNNPDVAATGADPLAHYEAHGAAEGRSPSPLFDDRFYLGSNPDVAAAGANPLLHYEQFGWHEGRNPNPLFDNNYYLGHNPDVAASGMNPLVHYDEFGWKEGRNPDALFDTRYYLSHNPDVAAADTDPLAHFASTGWHEGRNPDALFDVSYYLAHNPDVAASGMNPLVHYDEFGWKEGRNPSAAFSTNAYLNANPDVKAAGMDPLAHYFASGMTEGRAIYAVT